MAQILEFRVSGNSMKPFCVDGQTIVVDTAATYNTGDVIAFRHPFRTNHVLVKRVTMINGAKESVGVRGDNPEESTDSRSFGSVLQKNIIGTVVEVV